MPASQAAAVTRLEQHDDAGDDLHDADERSRGVVGTGPVGSRALGRWRLFRYEVRCWRGGAIPDLAYAAGGPVRLTSDPGLAAELVALVGRAPRPVWGRDELRAGEMWNSNSLISWLITRSDLDIGSVVPPTRGRAPGWQAGIVIARRERPPHHPAGSEADGAAGR